MENIKPPTFQDLEKVLREARFPAVLADGLIEKYESEAEKITKYKMTEANFHIMYERNLDYIHALKKSEMFEKLIFIRGMKYVKSLMFRKANEGIDPDELDYYIMDFHLSQLNSNACTPLMETLQLAFDETSKFPADAMRMYSKYDYTDSMKPLK